jgi:hypothetical protein
MTDSTERWQELLCNTGGQFEKQAVVHTINIDLPYVPASTLLGIYLR